MEEKTTPSGHTVKWKKEEEKTVTNYSYCDSCSLYLFDKEN
jgi:hypothetical protein